MEGLRLELQNIEILFSAILKSIHRLLDQQPPIIFLMLHKADKFHCISENESVRFEILKTGESTKNSYMAFHLPQLFFF